MNYQKPVVITQDNIAEGIYTARPGNLAATK